MGGISQLLENFLLQAVREAVKSGLFGALSSSPSSIVQQDVPSSTIQALPPLPMGDLASPSAVTDVHTNDSVVDIGWKSSVLKFLIGATVLLAALVAAAKVFG